MSVFTLFTLKSIKYSVFDSKTKEIVRLREVKICNRLTRQLFVGINTKKTLIFKTKEIVKCLTI